MDGADDVGKAEEIDYAHLRSMPGFGNFLSYQVLVDLLYPLEVYGNGPLLPYGHDDWSSPGPGAQRGITMLLSQGSTAEHLEVMGWLRDHQSDEFARLSLDFPYLQDRAGRPIRLSLANIQNCLCEFHKYVKISAGTGRGRRKFAPPPTVPLSLNPPCLTRASFIARQRPLWTLCPGSCRSS
jgi:hypothetical protein